MHLVTKLVALLGLVATIAFGAAKTGEATPGSAATHIRHFVLRPGVGYYEVLEGSGGGGAFINSSRNPMSNGTAVHGYTDRGQRGETMRTDYKDSGLATRAGYGWAGADRSWASNVGVPLVVQGTVPTSTSADYYYSFVEIGGSRYERDMPIGTR